MNVLACYFKDRVETLRSFLLRHTQLNADVSSIFLDETFICMLEDKEAPKYTEATDFRKTWHSALLCLLRQKKENVLAEGCRECKAEVEFFYPNRLHNYFHTVIFRKVHSMIGDKLFCFIIEECFVFTKDSGFLVQICGRPLYKIQYIEKTIACVTRREIKGKPLIVERKLKHMINGHFMTKDASFLVRAVFKRDLKSFSWIENLFMRIKRNTKTIPLFTLLNHHCPITQQNTQNKAITRLLCSVIRRILPSCFFGSKRNLFLFLKKVDLFVGLNKFERMSIDSFCNGLKTKQMLVCNEKECFGLLNSELHSLISLVVKQIVCPTIKTCFHVTEQCGSSETLYFRHEAWQKKTAKYLKNNLLFTRTEKGSFPSLKLVPKNDSLRMIVQYSKAENNTLCASLAALQKITKMFRESKVKHVCGTKDIRKELCEFRQKHLPTTERFFCVSADIKNCFDSISQSYLLKTVEKCFALLKAKTYNLKKQTVISSFFKQIRYKHSVYLESLLFRQRTNHANGEGKILIEKIVPTKIRLKNILLSTLRIIKNFGVCIDGKPYLRKNGINQGCVLSSLLCRIFLNEANVSISQFVDDCSLLLQSADDYLFVTTKKQSAELFIEQVKTKLSVFGMELNSRKTSIAADCSMVAWNCFLIDSRDLSIHAKKTSSAFLSISQSRRSFSVFLNKIRRYTVSSFDQIFTDPKLNTDSAIKNNIRTIMSSIFLKACFYIKRSDLEIKHKALEKLISEISCIAQSCLKNAGNCFFLSETKEIARCAFRRALSKTGLETLLRSRQSRRRIL